MNIQGKVALVTGGAVRVGKAITLMLAQAGAHVVVNYHGSAEAAQETAAEARALGVEALPIQCDVADSDAVQAMARQVNDRWGGIDILVNSASYFGKIAGTHGRLGHVAPGHAHLDRRRLLCRQRVCARHA